MNKIGLIAEQGSSSTPPFIPDEIIRNILIWLPVKSAMRCRLVCRRWRDITLALDFVDSHLRNSIPTILVTKFNWQFGLDLFVLDGWSEIGGTGTGLRVHKFPVYSGMFSNSFRSLFSHDGLVVLVDDQFRYSKKSNFSRKSNFIILNPTKPSHEHVRITLSEELRRSKIYGVYFHPSLKECCCLWKIEELVGPCWNQQTKRIQYKVLNLGYNPSLKTISNPFSDRIEKENATPTFINNYLYWLLKPKQGLEGLVGGNDIMEFDIICQEFTVIPCPVEYSPDQAHLLNIDGILSFLLIFTSKIRIWRLKDRAEQLWKAVEYTLCIKKYNYSEELVGIAFVDGKLALMSNKRLLVCNLMEKTVKYHPKEKMYCDRVLFLSHQMSLISLSNCIPNISIDHDGEEAVVRAGYDFKAP